MKFTAVIIALSAVAALAQAGDVTAPLKNVVAQGLGEAEQAAGPTLQNSPVQPKLALTKRALPIPVDTNAAGLPLPLPQLKRRGATADIIAKVDVKAAAAAALKIEAKLEAAIAVQASAIIEKALPAAIDVKASLVANAQLLAKVKVLIGAAIEKACDGIDVDVAAIAGATINANVGASLAEIKAAILVDVQAEINVVAAHVLANIDVNALVAGILEIKGVVVKAGVNVLANLNVDLSAALAAVAEVVVKITANVDLKAEIAACVDVAAHTL
ncbi:hypothetical protein BGZ75_000355 [Mortierella antarctica]|nr:hypothetical protein BGZ75_000355 [Mortierella antarctica]